MSTRLPGSIYYRSVLVLMILLVLGFWGIFVDSHKYIEKRKQTTLLLAGAASSALTQHLHTAISLTYTLETLLREKSFEIDQEGLERFAGPILKQHPTISSLQYAPDGIVNCVVPLASNRAAIGHNLLMDQARNREAIDAVKTRRLTVSGPFELLQGGVALVARLPIFSAEEKSAEFWGFASVLVRIDDLMKASAIDELSSYGYEWNLYRIHPDTKVPHIFYGTTDKTIEDGIKFEINIPNAKWFLNIKPIDGWLSGQYFHIILTSAICVLIASGFAFFAFYLQKQPIILKSEVELRTAELNEAKDVLANSERRLSQIAENEQMFIWEVDENGLYTYCSKACERFFSYEIEEIVGKYHFYDLFHPEDREELKRSAFEVFKQKQPFKEFINRNLTKSGEAVWLSTSGLPILDDNGNLLGYRGADINITERRRLQEEYRRAAQLAALGTVAAGVAHEINNPIQGVMNYATMIQDAPEKTDRVMDLSRRIINESKRVAEITRELLDFARDNRNQLVLSDIRELVKSSIDLIEKKVARQGVSIELELPEDLPRTAVYRQGIQQIVINLVDNAADALQFKNISAPEKIIKVSCYEVDADNERSLCLEVGDRGVGMSREVLKKATEAFFSTKPSSKGTGLGLSIVSDIVNRHNGHLDIESVEGDFTRVKVYLPIVTVNTPLPG